MIVEDDALLREGLALLLRAEGLDVVAVTEAAGSFLAAVDEHKPDTVVVDVRHHPASGLDLAHQLSWQVGRPTALPPQHERLLLANAERVAEAEHGDRRGRPATELRCEGGQELVLHDDRPTGDSHKA
ncbi:hypothetical protein BB31_39545 [Amycolatopsis lurida NRRL 2430]|uniref:Response regulatory domain-containing protein n=1 Tax=Amycolatopsis lurida NRRL 2430 TaxID=1460371 RepID=A0A2P2FGD9_AMYLU|nr:hypothetical protein BB31_39545 [Amycolatopsis lurida NRRL 2430]